MFYPSLLCFRLYQWGKILKKLNFFFYCYGTFMRIKYTCKIFVFIYSLLYSGFEKKFHAISSKVKKGKYQALYLALRGFPKFANI